MYVIPDFVMPRKRHVSRNADKISVVEQEYVMPRKRHVSRNQNELKRLKEKDSHASQEACE